MAIAACYQGEIARAKHTIRNYMLGIDAEAQPEHTYVHDVLEAIKDITVSKSNLATYEAADARTTMQEATRQLNMDGEKYNIEIKLKMLATLTDSLEGKIYDGQ